MSSSLTIGQQRALAVLPKVTGSLSFCFSWVIIVAILRDVHGKRNKVYHRLVCGMACADVSSSFALALSTWPIPSSTDVLWAVGNTQTCTAQGFFTQFGISSPLYNVSLSLYYLLAVRYGWKEHELRRVEPFFHLFPFAWALGTAVAGLPLRIFNSANLWCWIADYPGRNENTNPYRWAFFYGPLWATILVVTINLILLFLYVRAVTLRSERYASIVTAGGNIRTESDHNTDSPQGSQQCDVDGNDFERTVSSADDGVYFDQGFSSSNAFSNTRTSIPATSPSNDIDYEPSDNQEQITLELSKQEQVTTADNSEPSISTSARLRSASRRLSNLFFRSTGSDRNQRSSSASAAVAAASVAKATQFARRRRQVAIQCLRYALAFYWTWIPISLVRILQTMNRPPVYALFVLAAMNTPMQGLPNFIVYLYPLVMKARKQTLANRQGSDQPKNNNGNLWAWIRISLSVAEGESKQ